ncbi:ABC transporter substrate-binding protein [Polymorphum gilvum]|uniref:Glycerol-3-phosphate ABC transporter substrate-binding protein n=1 Tax=Polymorphum gilvum (strain LMG 25793 / CGMCC 1.9160 / SL003B-26A1) TaxID=991905 RepID=F2J1P8_POLGS|nr:ABC transporter substrate-binding protein [Polymorphum gilvum]ADZ70849.1 Glycerol-3-phosphate ABC transporter substrate-binding protein [Polymorphum gilvum SL003B-26A1]
MLHRTFLGMATAVAILSAPLAALAQSMAPASDAPVTIRFYNYNLASAGIGRDATVEMLDSFAEAHPTIKVEGVAVPSADVMSRVQADVVAGQGPDIAQIVFSDLDYVVTNFGAPALEDIVPAGELEAHLAGIFPNGVELGRLDGKTYGLAYVFSTPVLFYNADVFRAAGLNPDAPPRTWDEVKSAALAIRSSTGKTGLIAGIFSPFDWMFQGLIRSNGGRVLSEDRKQLMFAEPEAVEALAILRDMAKSGAMENATTANGIEAMSSGQVGMYLTTSVVQASLLKGAAGKWELRAAAMPAFGDRPAVPTNSGSALVVFTQDPLKQRAAWELMKHLTSDYAYTIITSKIGYLPLRQSTIDGEAHLAPWLRENPLALPNIQQLSRMEPWVPHPGPNYRQIVTTMMNAAEQAVFGEGDPATILAEAQKRAQALMPR